MVRRGRGVPDAPLVSAVILAVDGSDRARRCLDSLPDGCTTVPMEAIVVSNGLGPCARRPLEQRDDVVLVHSRVNLGFAAGGNLAAKVARGRYLFFLNDDSTLEPGCVDRLIWTADRHPRAGAIGPRILSTDGLLQEAGSILWNDGHATHVGKGLPAGAIEYGYLRRVDYVSANGLLVRRSAWEAVQGFDERYFPAYFEDSHLAMSLRRCGLEVLYEPRARIVHAEGQSTSSRYRSFLMNRNRRRFVSAWSTELNHFDQRPGRYDSIAIEHAINLARGMPPRVVVSVLHDNGGSRWDLVERLAEDGWAVTVALGAGLSDPPPAHATSMVELGVDLRRLDVDRVLELIGTDVEAVVAPAPRGCRNRADGSVLPFVDYRQDEREALNPEMALRRVARRRPLGRHLD